MTEQSEHTASVTLRATFPYADEAEYARTLMHILGPMQAPCSVEILFINRESGDVGPGAANRDTRLVAATRRRRGVRALVGGAEAQESEATPESGPEPEPEPARLPGVDSA